jgi:enediyne biosynthesis protein E4
MPDGSAHPFFYKGNGDSGFTEMSDAWGVGEMKGYYNGAAYTDLNGDGNLDMIINAIDAPAVVLKNNAPKKNTLSVSFKGEGGNTAGIGAKAYLFLKGKMQYQQLMLTRGFQSSVEPRLHFGTGDLGMVDSVLIVWPNQRCQLLKNVAANKPLVAAQKNAVDSFDAASFFPVRRQLLVPAGDSLARWRHIENSFIDVNVQYLIPHAQSSRGPKLAVADVNGDGLDDVYACGAKDQAGALFLGQASGGFAPGNSRVFEGDAGSEDIAAIFIDVNNDKAPDLVVASGGNEFLDNDIRLWDRLYINDGKGKFAKSKGLPFIPANKSCVAAADIDKDGDQDLFIGVLANSMAYGVPQSSALLLNDGNGNFKREDSRMPLKNIGMVTAAQWTDVDKNGFPDLLVAGEWMPLAVMVNRNGSFEKKELPFSSGWWQTLQADDVNGDGNMDFLAGNWGLNNKFWSGKDGKLSLYVADFDRNGSTDQLMAYSIGGKEFPFLAKDETERALPVLKKHYLRYAEYAGEEMKDVFYGFVDNMKPLRVDQLASVVGYGNGKGGFTVKQLPNELQLAPIFSFQKIASSQGQNTYAAGGNFFDVIPYEGRYDGQPLALFQFSGNDVRYMHQPSLFNLKGQVRDLQWLRRSGDSVLAVARNNEPLLFYKKN